MTKTMTRALTVGALMVPCVSAISYVKLLELPQGGSVCIGMLPIFLYTHRWGCKESFLASFAYGLLQLIFDGNYAWGPTSMLFDYVLAYGVLGVACLFRKQKGGVYIGTVVGCLCRFLVHFISGITIYRIYEPTELFNTTFANPYIYSAAYNGSYMVIELVLCLVYESVSLHPRLQRQLCVHRHGALPCHHRAALPPVIPLFCAAGDSRGSKEKSGA